ncbi:MAG: hypothetical protein HY819_08120 [Acidobacteria bacterium]|nr:hypothetical protein [Acidobacteriota bacterium]
MQKIKVKFNYGNDFRVFDVTLSIAEQTQGTGFVLALGQMEMERYIFLSSGRYVAQACYDLLDNNGGKKTCLFETSFQAEELDRISINFRKPTATLPAFSEPELADLDAVLKFTMGGRLNLRPNQSFATNVVKQISRTASLDERVVVDKNGKVEYEFNYNEVDFDYEIPVEINDIDVDRFTEATEDTLILTSTSKKKTEIPSPRPYTVHSLNYGHWNIDLYGLNSSIGAFKKGFRSFRSIAYLRPRSELFNRLPNFINENMAIARKLNDIV